VKAEKFVGTWLDQLESLFLQVIEHENHFMMYSVIDLEFGKIRCHSCKIDIVEGSRELVERIWIECSCPNSET